MWRTPARRTSCTLVYSCVHRCSYELTSANLDSDHKVLLLSTRWRYHRVNRPTTLNRTLKRKLKFEGRSDSLHSEFESRCEPEMVRLCVMFRSLPGDASQAVIDDCATALTPSPKPQNNIMVSNGRANLPRHGLMLKSRLFSTLRTWQGGSCWPRRPGVARSIARTYGRM